MTMDIQTVDHLLTTTRSVRKRLDLSRPVEPEIIKRCIEIATQAPSASNSQRWHFVVVTAPEQRAQVAAYYHRSFSSYLEFQGAQDAQLRPALTDAQWAQRMRLRESATYLSDHMHEVPVLVLPCIEGRVEHESQQSQAGTYGSILPATWSLMLALRARGLGSAWTTLHLRYEQEVSQVLGIPQSVTQAALLPVAYYTGDDFKPGPRLPLQDRVHWDRW